MAEIRDDLIPTDGLCHVFLQFESMESHMQGSGADITFRFVRKKDGLDAVISRMTVAVSAHEDGVPGMIARAYDQIVLILRQSLHIADKMRTHYKTEAAKHYPPGK